MSPESHDLFAVHVADDDVGDYHVSEAGWYAADEIDHIVMGPFSTLAECETGIRDRQTPPASSPS